MTKNKIASLLVIALTLGAQTVSAQSLYSTYGYASGVSTASNACVNLTSNLSYGSRGGQVSTLQSFLVSQNFPGGGSWMITGYFGNATRAAVVNLQQQRGLTQTGIVDSATRAAIYAISCGGSTVGSTIIAPAVPSNYYQNGTVYPYTNYGNGYTNGVSLNITSLSRNTGSIGDTVTIYGTGFDSYNNIVYIGTQTIQAASSNGTSITFTIPTYVTAGTVNLHVTNSRGTSNDLSFVVNSYSYACGGYYSGSIYNGSYGNCVCGNSGVYAYNSVNVYPTCQTPTYTNNTQNPQVSYLSPSNGAVGTTVTVFGSGFSTTNNTVHFGTAVIAGLYSYDGRSVSFIVPAVLNGYGTQPIGLGSYPVSVSNSYGYTSNDVSFTVTSTNNNPTSLPIISSLSSTTGYTGSVVTVYGTGLTSDSVVHFGTGVVANAVFSNAAGNGTQSITFTVPSYLSPYCATGVACPMYAQLVTTGSYPVSVINTGGISNTISFQVR